MQAFKFKLSLEKYLTALKNRSVRRSLTVINIKHKSWNSFFIISSPKHELSETEGSIWKIFSK